MLTIVALLVLTAIVPLAARAQPAPAELAPGFQVVALADFADRTQWVYMRSPTDAVPLSAPILRRSALMEARRSAAPLVFAVKTTDPQTGSTRFVPVAQVAWPAGASERALVFLAPGPDGRVGAVAVDDGLAVFPWGTLRTINFTGETMLGKFGGFEGAIRPGAGNAVPYPDMDTPEGTTGRFRIGVAREDAAGNVRLIFNGWTEAWPTGRTLLLIRPEGRRLQVRTLVDTQ